MRRAAGQAGQLAEGRRRRQARATARTRASAGAPARSGVVDQGRVEPAVRLGGTAARASASRAGRAGRRGTRPGAAPGPSRRSSGRPGRAPSRPSRPRGGTGASRGRTPGPAGRRRRRSAARSRSGSTASRVGNVPSARLARMTCAARAPADLVDRRQPDRPRARRRARDRRARRPSPRPRATNVGPGPRRRRPGPSRRGPPLVVERVPERGRAPGRRPTPSPRPSARRRSRSTCSRQRPGRSSGSSRSISRSTTSRASRAALGLAVRRSLVGDRPVERLADRLAAAEDPRRLDRRGGDRQRQRCAASGQSRPDLAVAEEPDQAVGLPALDRQPHRQPERRDRRARSPSGRPDLGGDRQAPGPERLEDELRVLVPAADEDQDVLGIGPVRRAARGPRGRRPGRPPRPAGAPITSGPPVADRGGRRWASARNSSRSTPRRPGGRQIVGPDARLREPPVEQPLRGSARPSA